MEEKIFLTRKNLTKDEMEKFRKDWEEAHTGFPHAYFPLILVCPKEGFQLSFDFGEPQ